MELFIKCTKIICSVNEIEIEEETLSKKLAYINPLIINQNEAA